MRALAIFAALTLVTAPVLMAPAPAFADGIERPRAPRPRPAPAPVPAPPLAVIEQGPETVTLSDSFFASSGGVGADIGVGGYYSSSTVIIRGSSARASAFAFSSARASARGRDFGHGGGGHGCGCR